MSSFEDNNWLGNMNQNYILNSEQMFDFLKKKLVTHDHTKLYNSVKLSFGQFVFCLCIFCIFMFPFESPPDDNNRVGKEKHICCLHNLKQKIIFGSDRRSRSYNLCPSVCLQTWWAFVIVIPKQKWWTVNKFRFSLACPYPNFYTNFSMNVSI